MDFDNTPSEAITPSDANDSPQKGEDPAKGTFIVLEGTDGAGKHTQFKLLASELRQAGHDIEEFDFPRYDKGSSYFVKRYLNGEYGDAAEVGPYTGSLFYALDRYDAAAKIREALKAGKVVLVNRFTASNMAHQGTKFNNDDERRGYYIWLDNLEFELLGIPRPDLNVVLRVPAETAQKLVDQKAPREYTTAKRDLHEADLDHLKKAVNVFDELCQLFPKDFASVDCVRNGELMEIDAIHKLVREKVSPWLPKPNHRNRHAAATATEHRPAQEGVELAITHDVTESLKAPALPINEPADTGDNFLDQTVTDSAGNVYGFKDTLSQTTIAAAMARLSRRGDDMRAIILDEFASAAGKDEELLQRVITAYGDDSVQQLVGVHMVVEKASNILTKKLEWGRLASYLEQSTRYIYYDQQDEQGNYRYHTPANFDDATTTKYRQMMDAIFGSYSKLVHDLTSYVRDHSNTPESERDGAWKNATRAQACDAARPVLPTATESTVGIFASGQALESLIIHLLADELPEARAAGQKLLTEARKSIPAFLERADKPERGGAIAAYMANTRQAVKRLAQEQLAGSHAASVGEPVTLTDVWPRNELDLVPDMLYEHSDLPLKDIRQQVNSWPYDRKVDTLHTYMGERLNRRHRPGRAIEKAHYSFDLLCDYGIFRDLQRHRMVDDLAWQELTPRFGYDIPKLVDDAGLSEIYEACFDASLALYSYLQQQGYALEAQYAVLLGHRMRWKVTYNAREAFHLHELRTSPQGHPGYRKLVGAMHEKIREVHPLLAEAMRFVNQDEDPELTRLAAERYSQYKLQNLDSKQSKEEN